MPRRFTDCSTTGAGGRDFGRGARARANPVQPRRLRLAYRARRSSGPAPALRRAHEGARHRRDGVHGRSSCAAPARRRDTTVAALVRPASVAKAEELGGRRDRDSQRRPDRRGGGAGAHATAARSSTTSPPPTAKRASAIAAYTRVNVDGTRHVLEAARRGGASRVVHCSTGGVHGHIEHPPANEDAPLAPGDVYQRTKLEAEQLASRFGRAAWARRRRRAADWHLRPRRHALPEDVSRHRARPLSDARSRQGLLPPDLHRRPGAAASSCAAQCRRPRGGPTSSPGPSYTTLSELVDLIARGAARRAAAPAASRSGRSGSPGALCEAVCVPLRIEPPLFRRRVDFYRKSRAFDTTRAREELGYNPAIDLRTGIRLTADWYRSQGLL